MLIVNWFDGVIVLLAVLAVLIGRRIGFFVQLCVVAAFFGGLFLAGWLFPHILPIHDRTILTIINGNLVLIVACYAAIRGYDLGRHLHVTLGKSKNWRKVESGLGVLLSVMAVLVTVWLIAAMIGRLPFEGFSNSADDSYIVQSLDHHLPAVPAVLAEFNRLVDANSSPEIFVQSVSTGVNMPNSLPANFQAAVNAATSSTVRITSFGCGGIVSGSGFAVAPDLVVTNAHVIAGVHRPIIKTVARSYVGIPVLFDPSLDLAVLQVPGLKLPPLSLASSDVKVGNLLAVLGYPDGNYAVAPGVIRNNFTVFGRNIYNEGVVGRDVYEIETNVDPGSSGGPVILQNGQVAGIIFAKSDEVDDYGYAITSPSLLNEINQAEHTTRRVSDGVCLAD